MLTILCDQCQTVVCELGDADAVPPILVLAYTGAPPAESRHFCGYRCVQRYAKEARKELDRSAMATGQVADQLAATLGMVFKGSPGGSRTDRSQA